MLHQIGLHCDQRLPPMEQQPSSGKANTDSQITSYQDNKPIRNSNPDPENIISTTQDIDSAPAQHKGQVFFIRHGESTSNERNIFAGVLDVALTPYGRQQARRAGKDIRRKGIQFDAVYVSHLRRARQTCDIALQESQALRNPEIKPIIDHRISERSTGILTGENKNLCRQALGHNRFEAMVHAHNEAPPGGETIENVYSRVVDFYKQQVIPRLERGENVLVVCHEYVLEPLSVYLCGLPASAYKRLKLPNAKALSCVDLMRFRDDEASAGAMQRKSVNDLAAMHAVMLYALSFIVAAATRLVLDSPAMPTSLFRLFTVAGLAISTFYTYLSLDFKETAKNVSAATTRVVLGWWCMRWLLAVVLIASGALSLSIQGEINPTVLWLLLLLVPPGLTTATLSMVWGGNLYPSAALSKNLSLVLPLLLLVGINAVLPTNAGSGLIYFYGVILVGLAIPALLAQVWRRRSPVTSNHHSNEFKFIGVLSVMLINGSVGYQLTPPTLLEDLFQSMPNAATIHSDQQLVLALVVFLGMRLTAWLTLMIVRRLPGFARAESQDIWILLTQPNLVLWLSTVMAASTATPGSATSYVLFWAATGYCCLPLLDQMGLIRQFSTHLLQESLQTSRLSEDKIQEIFNSIDEDKSGRLSLGEIKDLLRLIEQQTTGLNASEETLDYVSKYMLQIMDADQDGHVSNNELKRYISTYGLVANLNLERQH